MMKSNFNNTFAENRESAEKYFKSGNVADLFYEQEKQCLTAINEFKAMYEQETNYAFKENILDECAEAMTDLILMPNEDGAYDYQRC